MDWKLIVEAAKTPGRPGRVLDRLGVAPEERDALGRAVVEMRARMEVGYARRRANSGYDELAARRPGHAARNWKYTQKQRAEAAHRAEIQAITERKVAELRSQTFVALAQCKRQSKAVREAKNLLGQTNIYDWTVADLQRVSAALVAQALCEELVRRGWTRDHWSRIHGGTSFYLFSPDRSRRVRISDHDLPSTLQREHDGVMSGYVVSGDDSVDELVSLIEAGEYY